MKFIKNTKYVLIAVTLFVTAGCASTVETVGKYKGLNNLDENKGTVYVYRESSFVGGANQYDILKDNKLVGSVPNGSFFTVIAEPGEYFLKADTGSFGEGAAIVVHKGEVQCLKMTLNFCMSCKSADLTPVDTTQCENEIVDLEEVKLEVK